MSERIFQPSAIHQYHGYAAEIYEPKLRVFPRPVLVVPGFGSSAESMQMVGYELALQGFTVICADLQPGYEQKKFGFLLDIDKAKREAILGIIKSEVLLHERYQNPSVDVIAHSKAAIEVILEARDHPEDFRNIVLVAPAGIHPGRGFFEVAKILAMGDIRNQKDKKRLQQEGGVTADLLHAHRIADKSYRKSKLRVLLEGFTSATVSIDRYFPELQEKGIRIAIVAQEDDVWYPPRYLNPHGGSIAGVERFEVLRGVHGAMKVIPESCREVINILREMNSDVKMDSIAEIIDIRYNL